MRLRERVFLLAWTSMPSYLITPLINCLRLLFRRGRQEHCVAASSTPDRANDRVRSRCPPRLKIYWWRPALGGFTNFGDELGPLLVEQLFGLTYCWAPPETCDAIVIGSVLEKVCATRRESPPIVWGAGFIGDGRAVPLRSITAAAVRGRFTAKRFGMEDSLVTGDPGLLCSRLLDRMPDKQYQAGLVLHYTHDKFDVTSLFTGDVRNVCTIDVRMPPLEVIKKIAACETIFSTSLHGLVVADSFGIPNQWIKLPRRLLGGDFKFYDYYSAFPGNAPQCRYLDGKSRWDVQEAIVDIAQRYGRPGKDAVANNLILSFQKCLL